MSFRVGENVEEADWLHLTEGEEVQWVGRPSRYTIAISIGLGVVLALIGVALTVWLSSATAASSIPGWVAYLPLVLSVLGVGRAVATYLDWLRQLYVVTDEEIYVKRGLISRNVTQIRLDRVQNTAFDQSVLERFLSYGDVEIYTAGTGTEDLELRNVPNPEEVKRTLTRLLSDRAEATGARTGRI